MNKKLSTAGFGLLAVGALVLGGASAAVATGTLSYSPNPVSDGESVVVSSGDELSEGRYRVGICTYATFGTGIFEAPACGAQTVVDLDEEEVLVGTTGDLFEAGNANFHSIPALPDQPATFDCGVDECEVVIVDHSTRDIVASAPLVFN